jgi:Flp pilus assembly protein TadG
MRHRGDRDRGGSTVELAILWPAILVLVFGAVQAATYFTARTVALSAAQIAATTERQYQASEGAGVQRADAFLERSGDWLRNWEIIRHDSGDDVVAFTVTGDALSIVPGVNWQVSQTAHGTVERFTS